MLWRADLRTGTLLASLVAASLAVFLANTFDLTSLAMSNAQAVCVRRGWRSESEIAKATERNRTVNEIQKEINSHSRSRDGFARRPLPFQVAVTSGKCAELKIEPLGISMGTAFSVHSATCRTRRRSHVPYARLEPCGCETTRLAARPGSDSNDDLNDVQQSWYSR